MHRPKDADLVIALGDHNRGLEAPSLEARMITIPATLALEHVDEPRADSGTDAKHGNEGDSSVDGGGGLVEDSPPDGPA